LCSICILKGGLSGEENSCPLADISICIWDSSDGVHGGTAVTQPSTADRLTAVGWRADISHLQVPDFLNSIINYFSVFALNTEKYGLYLLHKNNHKPSLSEQNCPCNVYGIHNLCNYSIYVVMVLTYESISTDSQDFVSEMLYKQNN